MSNTLDTTSLTETYLHFLIQIKKKEVEDFKEQLGQLEDKKQKMIKLQEQMKEEKTDNIRKLQKNLEEQESNLEKRQQEKEEEMKQMAQEDLELKHKLEEELEELRCKLARLQVELEELREERERRLQYKNESSMKDLQIIQKLEKDIALTQRIYQDISEHFQKSLVAVEENEQKVENISKEEFQLVFERVKENLDNCNISDVGKHNRLKEQVTQYRKKVALLESTVCQLQEENLGHIDCLFHTLHKDAFIRRDVEFLVQSASVGSHDTEKMDRNVMKISPEETSELVDISQQPLQPSVGTEETQQNTDFTEPMHLEEKLLCVIGKAAHLHPSEEMTFDLQQTERWTVTTKIINSKFRQPESDASEKDTGEFQQELDEN